MTLITASLVEVMRARRGMEQAFEQNDWDAIKAWDTKVAPCLDAAFDDPERDNSLLVSELEKILKLYAAMVAHLPEHTAKQWLSKF